MTLSNALHTLQLTRTYSGELIASGLVRTAAGFRPIATEGNRTLEEVMEGLELGLRVIEAEENLPPEH